MRLSKREVDYLLKKKLKEGKSEKEAYAEMGLEFEFIKKIDKERREKKKMDKKDFKKEFSNLVCSN